MVIVPKCTRWRKNFFDDVITARVRPYDVIKPPKTRFAYKIRRKRDFNTRFSLFACILAIFYDTSIKTYVLVDFGQEKCVRNPKFGHNRKIGQNSDKIRKFFLESKKLCKVSTLGKFQVRRMIWSEIMANQRF